MKTIFLVMGRTGAGKDSLVNNACKELGLSQIISYTTRPRRDGEGHTHIFIDKDDVNTYDNKIAYTNINGNEYFATKDQLYDNDFYVIDPNGTWMMQLSGVDLSDFRFVKIMVTVPYIIRKERAINSRGDNKEVFESRNFDEHRQFDDALIYEQFDYAIENIDFNKASKVFNNIVSVELGLI